jgi:hypothetical protein
MSLSPASRILALFVFLPSLAFAQARPASTGFGALAGSWSGTGSVTLTSGSVERIRCQASYEVAPSGNTFQQSLRCTSDSYDFHLRASVIRSGDAISGTWTETTRNANGGIAGRVSGSQIQANIQGPAFSASLALQTQGDRQTVNIRSQGTELSAVTIALRRTG